MEIRKVDEVQLYWKGGAGDGRWIDKDIREC